MQKKLIREMAIYAILLILLAFVMHSDLLSSPTERFSLMQERENYLHPFVYAFIIYIFLLFIRFIVKKTATLFKKIRDK